MKVHGPTTGSRECSKTIQGELPMSMATSAALLQGDLVARVTVAESVLWPFNLAAPATVVTSLKKPDPWPLKPLTAFESR
jgi:hypothetical protein